MPSNTSSPALALPDVPRVTVLLISQGNLGVSASHLQQVEWLAPSMGLHAPFLRLDYPDLLTHEPLSGQASEAWNAVQRCTEPHVLIVHEYASQAAGLSEALRQRCAEQLLPTMLQGGAMPRPDIVWCQAVEFLPTRWNAPVDVQGAQRATWAAAQASHGGELVCTSEVDGWLNDGAPRLIQTLAERLGHAMALHSAQGLDAQWAAANLNAEPPRKPRL